MSPADDLSDLRRRLERVELWVQVHEQQACCVRRRFTFGGSVVLVLAAWLLAVSLVLSQDFEVRTGAAPGTPRLQVYDGPPPRVAVTNASFEVRAANELRLYNSADTFYIAHKAGTVTANRTFTWPDSVGSSGQVLKTDGLGGLSWTTLGGMIPGAAGQTLRHNGSDWVANSFLYNDGTKIGIGTSAPQSLLHLAVSSGNPTIRLDAPAGFGSVIEHFNGATLGARLRLFPASDTRAFDIANSADTRMVTVLQTGSVGIGTTSPSNAQGWGRVLDLNHDVHAKLLVTENTAGVKTGIFSHSSWWTGGVGKIGTESSHPLALMAGYGNDVMTLTTSGNVGIGTTSPGYKLHVKGTVLSENPVGDAIFAGTSGAANEVATFGWSLGGGFAYVQGGIWGGVTKPLVLQGGGGNVGLSYGTPAAKLHINDSVRGQLKLLSTSGVGHDFGYDGGGDSVFAFANFGASTGWTAFTWHPNESSTSNLLVIRNDGKVGVGTTDPDLRLHVAGDLRVGALTPAGFGSTPGWGDALVFSGGPILGFNSDNSDPLWIARYNAAFNDTELRIVIGDDPGASEDKLVVGTMWGSGDFSKTATWGPLFTVQANGNVGVGTTTPGYALHVIGDVKASASFISGANHPQDRQCLHRTFAPTGTRPCIEEFGEGVLQNGRARVLFSEDYNLWATRMALPNIQVTSLGKCGGLYVAERSVDGFEVRDSHEPPCEVRFMWHARTVRKGAEGHSCKVERDAMTAFENDHWRTIQEDVLDESVMAGFRDMMAACARTLGARLALDGLQLTQEGEVLIERAARKALRSEDCPGCRVRRLLNWTDRADRQEPGGPKHHR